MEITSPKNGSNGGGCVILLDVPPGSAITIDGITRLTPSPSPSSFPFNHGVFIISDIPSPSSSAVQFHLLLVRCGSTNNHRDRRVRGDCDIRALPVGFILTNNKPPSSYHITNDNKKSDYEWMFARRYDPRTEEISNNPVDELTLNNLLMAMREGGELSGILGKNFIMRYEQFMQTPSNTCGNSNSTGMDVSISSWAKRTSLINTSYLQRRHSLTHGDKIVPSSYIQEEGEGEDIQNESPNKIDNKAIKTQDNNIDGKQITYPQIPCIDPTINARRLTRHSGTRSYLSKLLPETRTKLLLGGDGSGGVDADSFSVGEYVWNDILCRIYGISGKTGSNDDRKGNESDFLADVQLSFLMFLFLECHSSLEHWRDAISMCSLAVMHTATTTDAINNNNNNNNFICRHALFFQQLLSIIHDQFLCIETEFFQEVEYSSGQQNFLIHALERLCWACDDLIEGVETNDDLKSASTKLKCMLRDRFHFNLSTSPSRSRINDAEMEIEEFMLSNNFENKQNRDSIEQEYEDDDDGEEEDGPVIVPYDQIESSLLRSAALTKIPTRLETIEQSNHRQNYPLLFAAMSQQEDVVMCAARILDEKKDVSLVREAAAYLEEVEAHRKAYDD